MHPPAQPDFMCLDREERIRMCTVEHLKRCSVEAEAG